MLCYVSNQRVERYGWVLGADGEHGGIDRKPDGGFVRYSDYEKMREEREKLRAEQREAVALDIEAGRL